jgi:hypothetical protein
MEIFSIVCVAPTGLIAYLYSFPPLTRVGSVITPLAGFELLSP